MDKYVKVKQIGEGSFGKALLVKSKENGKQFVVKEINMAKMSRKERDDARKETAVLAQLHHPNIVMYRESFEEIGHLYIVMDYCDGGDLYARINMQRGVLFPEDTILDWFVQTCLAVKHIHDRKILHRDIKSQNIFLTRHGIVKLGDFGIAKVLNSTVELARTCIGTPYYLSPEICENKPYNNKSDIWSLGCVLYEVTTLKHAFESGNMKNLVLKIIRGSYPPPSPRYSYELRNLIAALFRRSARDRPSITSVLRKPILQMRIRKFLSESEHEDEFSHTVMHGKKIQKALPPAGRVFAQPPRPVAAKKTPVRATPRYDPASVYAPSVARRSKENNARRSADVKKASAEKRPSSAGASTPDLVKRRKELIVKERKRREEQAKQKEQQYMRQHRDMIEKQRVARMMRAREEGWRCLMSSQESNSSDKVMKDEPKRPSSAASPRPGVAPRDRGNYEAYNAWLDKLEEERKKGPAVAPRPVPHLGVAGALGYQDAPSPSPAVGGAVPSAQMAARQGEQAAARGADAAERARILQEYQLRKQQAAAYKARAQGNVFGTPAPRRAAPAPKPSAGRPSSSNSSNQPTPASSRDGENEQDYLARLRQIRLQNFNERRMQKANQEAKADAKYKPSVIDQGNELRRKKIEALRAQAEDRANKLKADLERKRREAYDYEQRRLRNEAGREREADKAQKPPLPAKPVKVIPLTEAMNAISASKAEPSKPEIAMKPAVGMTAAMQAIGVAGSPPPAADKPGSSPLQKRKQQILKRLNAKPPWAGPKQERHKWGEPVAMPAMPAMERPQWNSGEKSPFSQLPLEETASHMEATNAGDLVVRHPHMVAAQDIPVAPSNIQKEAEDQRKHWGGPAGTVLNVLQSAQLTDTATSDVSEVGSVEGAVQAEPAKVADSTEEKEEPHQTKAPVIGSTFTVIRSPLRGISVMQKVSPKKESGKKDETDATEATDSVTEPPLSSQPSSSPPSSSQPSSSPPDRTQEQPSPPVRQDDSKEDMEDREADESVAEGSPQVAPQQPAIEPAAEKGTLFEKVQQSKQTDGASARSSERLQVEDVEEEEEPKTEDTTEKTLTKDEMENKDSEMAAEQVEEKEEKEDEAAAAIDVEVKNLAGTTAGVILGLTLGHFDAAINLLRTCSEPDLCKLSHTTAEAEVTTSVSDDALHDLGSDPLTEVSSVDEVTDEKGKSSDESNGSSSEPGESKLSEGEVGSPSPTREDRSPSENEKERETAEEKETDDTEAGKGEVEEGAGEEEEEEGSSGSTEDDEELDTVRASMLLVLEGASASDEEEPLTAKSSSKKTKEKKTTKVKKSKSKVKATDTVDSPNRKWSASSMADLCSIRETMKGLLQPRPCEEPKRALPPLPDAGRGDADQPVISPSPSYNVGESWQSDEDDDDYFEEDDMFSRLEESREKLEQELGCDIFLNAYKTVQKVFLEAIHEDEDENIEEGVRLVSQILGKDKEHLYPSILQLVMADGVFTEDND